MQEALIFDAIRTPRGKGRIGGRLHEVGPVDLLAGLMREMATRHGLDTARIDDVVIGCAQPSGDQAGVIGRLALLAAGWHIEVPALQISRYCGSSLDAVNQAAARVRSGWEHLIVAGGVESMSRVGIGRAPGARDSQPQLVFSARSVPQGISADLMATLDGRTRADLDALALSSQQRAARAWSEQRFARSVVPVRDINGVALLEQDELVRPDTSLASLGALAASFEQMGREGHDAVALLQYPQLDTVHHLHTAGNSSGIADGAALVLIGNDAAGQSLGLKPRGRILATAACGSEPTLMLGAPARVSRMALDRAGLDFPDIDLFEVNEAFAAVVLRFIDETGVAPDRINVNGGSMAFGHPLGATGSMLLGTVLDELERAGKRRGLITLCAADGMGVATVIERV